MSTSSRVENSRVLIFAVVAGLTSATGCRQESAPRASATGAIVDARADAQSRRLDARGDSAAATRGPGIPGPARSQPRRLLPAGLPEGKVITLIHTANLRGEYEAHPLGGLARRATYVAETKRALLETGGGLLHVDVGDSLLPVTFPDRPDDPAPDPTEVARRARLLATGLQRLGLDAFVPGESDLAMGWTRFVALAKAAKLPVLLANVADKKGRPLFPGSRIIEVGKAGAKTRVGMFGVLDLDEANRKPLVDAGLQLLDARASAQANASDLRHRGAQIVIALCHLGGGLNAATALAKSIAGVDLLVLGHDPQLLEDPVMVGGAVGDSAAGAPLIVAAGERGRFLGRLDFHVFESSAGFAVPRVSGAMPAAGQNWLDHQLVRLNERFLSDPATTAFIAPYLAMSRRRIARKLPVGLTARAGTKGELADSTGERWTYGTTPACRFCHAEETKQFDTTSHAFALQTLERKVRHRDPYCLGCHSTGFDQPGGTRNLQTANVYFGPVGCESCHGPSVKHVRTRAKADTTLKVAESVCLPCHNNQHAPEPFDFPSALKATLGPGHGG